MTYGDKRRVVSFNLDRERELYELAGEINFSQLVKRALAAELERRRQTTSGSEITVVIELEES